jgi:hypothetical protein
VRKIKDLVNSQGGYPQSYPQNLWIRWLVKKTPSLRAKLRNPEGPGFLDCAALLAMTAFFWIAQQSRNEGPPTRREGITMPTPY